MDQSKPEHSTTQWIVGRETMDLSGNGRHMNQRPPGSVRAAPGRTFSDGFDPQMMTGHPCNWVFDPPKFDKAKDDDIFVHPHARPAALMDYRFFDEAGDVAMKLTRKGFRPEEGATAKSQWYQSKRNKSGR